MADSERGFLCGLLRDNKPKKIVEVGVAAGGTTSVILNCICELQIQCQVYSVDLVENCYRNKTKKTGYLLDELSEDIRNCHQLLLGQILPMRLDEIGGEIDFLILDTVHTMPGELLDFIAVFPYLAHNATVVLHDTVAHYRSNCQEEVATSVLFQSVTADKFLNYRDQYPNIAAFKINKDTSKYIMDIFAALILPWSYMPEEEYLQEYETIISHYYPAECLHLYHQALQEADVFLNNRYKRNAQTCKTILELLDKKYSSILLYGPGKRGKALLELSSKMGIEIKGFIVSDDRSKERCNVGVPIYTYSQIPFNRDQTLIIQTVDSTEVEDRLLSSGYHWLRLPWLC